MASIDDFFATDTGDFSHPRLRQWKKWLDEQSEAQLELYRPEITLGLARARMFVHFRAPGKQDWLDEADWDESLNQGLIRMKVRAVDARQESERFALGLRDALRMAETEFGNGYFNSVLLDLIVDSELAEKHAKIAEILKFTHHATTERNGRSYDRCRETIALAISGRAKELTASLGYAQEEAKTILAGAIAQYLDERFSVTRRRELGLLS